MEESKIYLKFRNVKQFILIGIALSVAFLINLPRLLELYNVVDGLGKSFTSTSIKDITLRTLVMLIFSWLVLQFNTNWKLIYRPFSKPLYVLITILTNIFLLAVTIYSFFNLYPIITNTTLNPSDKGLLYFVYFVVLLILIFISRILRFQIIHEDDITEKESLKRQGLQNELSALKNQINPHFLFNSLNSLNSLIRDNKEATMFVNKLSFMYRYILQSGQQDVSTLREELKFLESYIYLIKTRYRNRFNVQIDIDDKWLREDIPTLALQLLVENAVKHNEISEQNPLLVKLYVEDNFLVVENIIRPRKTFVDSTGQGLANIDKRYTLLKGKHISISNIDAIFKVKLPLNINT